MRTEFNAPPRGETMQAHRADANKIRDHMHKMLSSNYHAGQMQHMGGTASLINHLDNEAHGEAHNVKKELKGALDYLYYFATTGHPIYRYLAEDKLEHIHMICESITCPKERAHAMYFLEITREYMTHLGEGQSTHASMPTSGGRVTL